MKRWIALVLTGLIMLWCLPAWAADYTVDEKFFRQAEQNAVKGSLSFLAEGEAPEGLKDDVWKALTEALGRVSLDFRHCLKRGDGEMEADILLDGENQGQVICLYNDTLAALGGNLLSPDGVFYAAPLDWDLTRLLPGDPAKTLPAALLSLAVKAQSASAEWQEKAQAKADEYLMKLGLFVNGFAQAQTGSQDGVLYSELSCHLEPTDVKAEMILLLEDFFEDGEFLALLSQIADPEEAALLSNPALQDAIRDAIREMPLEGQVEIIRRYDVMGNALLDSISLPFANDAEIASLTLAASDTGKEKSHTVSAVFPDGKGLEICYSLDENGKGKGSLRRTGENEKGMEFSYDWKENEETYSLQTDLCERSMQGVLTLQGAGNARKTLTMDVLFSSRSEKRSPTTMTATLSWKDAAKSTGLSATLTLKTAALWDVKKLDETDAVVRLDKMEDEEIRTLGKEWLSNGEETLLSVLMQALPALENPLQALPNQ